MKITTRSVEETYALGRMIGQAAHAGLVIALEGQLGAGKTHLVRGIAQGARVADPDLVSSPTYVFLNIYPNVPGDSASKTIYHLDAYRTAGSEEFEALGFEEWMTEAAVIVVEWPSRIGELLPEDHLRIDIDVMDETTRDFCLTATGPRAMAVIAGVETLRAAGAIDYG